MKRTILAAATISLASVLLTSGAAAEQPVAQSDVEARLDKLERINVTAYKAPQASESSDATIDAILQKADEAEHADSDAAQ
jgi:outer membrane lipoprotein-sorting protein